MTARDDSRSLALAHRYKRVSRSYRHKRVSLTHIHKRVSLSHIHKLTGTAECCLLIDGAVHVLGRTPRNHASAMQPDHIAVCRFRRRVEVNGCIVRLGLGGQDGDGGRAALGLVRYGVYGNVWFGYGDSGDGLV